MTRALVLFGMLFASGHPRSQAPPERTFRDAGCHLTFRYPVDWMVAIDSTEPGTTCRFWLRPVAWDSLLVLADSVEGAYTVGVVVEERGFEDALPTTAFRRQAGSWIVGGRHGSESSASAIERNGWRGVWGEPLLGCYRIDGPYVAACELPVALIGTATRSAQISGGVRTFAVFERVLATIELGP